MTSIAELLKLPAEERLAIAEAVWDSLTVKPSAVPARPDHVREVGKRLEDYGKGVETTSDWDEVRKEASAKFSG